MKDVFPELNEWVKQNKRFALATVINTWGSAPRVVGSVMAISEDREIIGSVSGGCVEGAVMKKAKQLLNENSAEKLDFGVTDEEAWTVGLSCGGKIGVYVEPFVAFSEAQNEQVVWAHLQSALQTNKGLVYITALQGLSAHAVVLPDGQLKGTIQAEGLVEEALRAYGERKNQTIEMDGQFYFLQVFPRKAQLLIVGAAHITVDLVALAKQFDFETVVIDPRGIFSEKTQFPVQPDHLYVDWPAEILPKYDLDAYSFAVLLTHDPKIDDQALHLLLRSDVAYIGALGSRRTHAKRIKRLTEAGFSESEIEQIHGPIGVSINAKLPKEIALSILGQIIQVKNRYL
ncbi:MAG: XdhC family protein [Bacteroidota bacterium]